MVATFCTLEPFEAGKGLNWLIDGRTDGVPAGTIYLIEFKSGLQTSEYNYNTNLDSAAVPAM